MRNKTDIFFGPNNNLELMKKEFVKRLLSWYAVNKRTFMWRKRVLTPYEVLVLELLLQRTQAERVEKVLDIFLRKFPNLFAVYIASDEELESAIRTLGLQKRRRVLLKDLAKCLVKKYGGCVPRKSEELQQLPGVGKYVANAVLCFSYNKPVPLVDTNVARVLGRVFGFPASNDPSTDKHLWIFAESILPRRNAKDFNWAIIDFGSLICKPKNPRCFECPLRDICKSHSQPSASKRGVVKSINASSAKILRAS